MHPSLCRSLADTERLYTVAQNEVLQRYGLSFSWELKVLMMGKRANEAAQALLQATGLNGRGVTAEVFLQQRDQLLAEMFPRADLMPGWGEGKGDGDGVDRRDRRGRKERCIGKSGCMP